MLYVVHSQPDPGEPAFGDGIKCFTLRADAYGYADGQVRQDVFTAFVYEVAVDDLQMAKDIVLAGRGGKPIYARTRNLAPGIDRPETLEELGF